MLKPIQIKAISINKPEEIVRERLGPPYFECAGVSIYVGDCITLMKGLPAGLFDLTVTSPPYNIGKEYERTLEIDEYLSWCEAWCNEVYRLSSDRGAFWLNLGYVPIPGKGRAIPLPYLLWPKLHFYLVQEVVWNYGAGVAARRMFSPRNEKWLWLVRDPESYEFNLDDVRDPNVKYPNQKKNGKLRVNPLGKNPTDVWQIPKVTTGTGGDGQRASPERTKHPAQFPEAVVERIVRACSSPDATIFDPFGGSGTTGVVALRTRRKCLLFELEERYAVLAAKRLQEAHSLMSLLD